MGCWVKNSDENVRYLNVNCGMVVRCDDVLLFVEGTHMWKNPRGVLIPIHSVDLPSKPELGSETFSRNLEAIAAGKPLDSEDDDSEDELSETRENVGWLEEHAGELHGQIRELKERYSNLERKTADVTRYARSLASVTDETLPLRDVIREIYRQREHFRLDPRSFGLDRCNNDRGAKIAELSEQVRTLQYSNEELTRERDALRVECSAMEKERNDARESAEKLRAKLGLVEGRLASAQHEYALVEEGLRDTICEYDDDATVMGMLDKHRKRLAAQRKQDEELRQFAWNLLWPGDAQKSLREIIDELWRQREEFRVATIDAKLAKVQRDALARQRNELTELARGFLGARSTETLESMFDRLCKQLTHERQKTASITASDNGAMIQIMDASVQQLNEARTQMASWQEIAKDYGNKLEMARKELSELQESSAATVKELAAARLRIEELTRERDAALKDAENAHRGNY